MYRRSYSRKAEGASDASSEAPVAPTRSDDGFDTYAVSFSAPFHGEGRGDGFRVSGKGSLGLGDQIRVQGSGRRPFGISKTIDLRLEPDRIVNVLAEGSSVRFEIAGEEAKLALVTLQLPNAATAAAVAARLPQARSAEFEQAATDVTEFNATLARVTPNAYLTPALIIINVIVFVLMLGNGAGLFVPEGAVHIRWGSNFGPLTTDGEWWRLFTCTFIHFGVLHLALNMWALFDSGRLVERLYGPLRFAVLYVGAGLGGSIASLLWNPAVNSAGASGAIFGVFGALLVYMLNPGNRVPLTVMKQHKVSTATFILYSLVNGFAHAGIDNAAHLGGLAAGAAIGLALARPLDPELRRGGAYAWQLALVAVAVPLLLAALAIPARNAAEPQRADARYQQELDWFQRQEKEMVAELKAWQASAKTVNNANAWAVADRLDQLAERWKLAHERLSLTVLPPGARMHEHHELLLRYSAGRRDAFKQLVQAIRMNDGVMEQRGLSTLAESNRTLEKLNALAKKK